MKKKLLFICQVNKLRSRTAEELFKDHPNYEVRSAGVSKDAVQPITEELLEWADVIFVMEKSHRNRIRKLFPEAYKRKNIECLYIPDEYDFMDPALITILKIKLEEYLKQK